MLINSVVQCLACTSCCYW